MSAGELSPNAALGVAPHGIVQAATSRAAFQRSGSHGLSLRSNFAWVLTGNLVFAACQWGMIVALAKLGNSFMVGQFSLGLAIATPVLMLSNFDLRAVQATDSSRQYRFAEYLRLRIAMTMAALIVIAAIAWFGRYERRTAMVILAVGLAKGIETLSDIHYGLFQLNDRLDQTGRSMMLRGAASVAALSMGLYLTRDVLWACIWLALAWLGALFFLDVRRGRRLVAGTETLGPTQQARGFQRQWRLLWLALPLGVVTTIASVNLHMPRYFIHARMGEHELGIFSALAYATIPLTLVGDSLGQCVLPRMSRLYAGGRVWDFRALLLRLLVAGCGIGLLGFAVARSLGARLLTVFYSPEYAAHSRVFILLMGAAAIHFAASMLTSGITSARWFRIQVPLYMLVAASTAIGCARWVPTMGLAGGALAVMGGAVVRLGLATAVVGCVLLAPGQSRSAWRLGL